MSTNVRRTQYLEKVPTSTFSLLKEPASLSQQAVWLGTVEVLRNQVAPGLTKEHNSPNQLEKLEAAKAA